MTILEMLADGQLPQGRPVDILSHALLAMAAWDQDYTDRQRHDLLETLLPSTTKVRRAWSLGEYRKIAYNLGIAPNAQHVDQGDMRELRRDSDMSDLTLEQALDPAIWRGEAEVHALNLAHFEVMGELPTALAV